MTLTDVLVKAGWAAPSADNSQPWVFVIKASVLTVMYDSKRVLNKTFKPDAHATYLSMGGLLENLNQMCNAVNFIPKWSFPDMFNPDNPVYFETLLNDRDVDINLDSLETHPLFNRHTYRFSFQKKQISSKVLDSITSSNIEHARAVVITDKDKIGNMASLVKAASQIRFKTQEIHEWLGNSLRFGKQAVHTRDGLDVATLDLPPGGGLFLRFISDWRRMRIMNYIGAYKFMSWVDSMPIKTAPALIAIIGHAGFRETLSAGQLMERIWIDLNEQGLAVHPYYVVPDQMNRLKDGVVPKALQQQAEQVSKQAVALFDLQENEVLHMMFRVGYPKRKNTKRSLRLPIEILCRATSVNSK